MNTDRRTFIKGAAVGGISISVPIIGCKSGGSEGAKEALASAPAQAAAPDLSAPPIARPADWEAVAYNKARGAAGFIPDTYLPSINGADGVPKHLGKHLPYVAKLEESKLVAGMLPIMWGNPELGYTRHPNAGKSESNPEGHWYNWIRIAVDGDASSEVETKFDNWPAVSESVNGKLLPFEGDDVAADSGKNTVYLAQLPNGLTSGTMVRVWAHCLTHGEYVDFLTV